MKGVEALEMRRFLPRRLQVFLVLIAGLTTLFLLTSSPQNAPSPALLANPFFHYNLSAEQREDPAQTCVIPRLHPFHPSIWAYLGEARTIRCAVRTPTLTYVDQSGWLRVNRTAMKESGYQLQHGSFVQKLTCQWRAVLRGGADQTSDDSVSYGTETPLDESGSPLRETDYIVVNCKNFAGVTVYQNVHAHVANVTAFRRPPPPSSLDEEDVVNVVIVGLDSMSRQAVMRLMPKTYKYLTEVLPAVIFTGMNKVGDNTFPNLIALLTGRAAYGPDLPNPSTPYEDWPLIWRNYSDAGYVTLWAEDFPDYGLFNYLDKGFKRPPVHHYLRPFWLAVKESSVLRTSSHMCLGNVPRHKLQLDYLQRFVAKYGSSRKTPHFAFSFLAELSHEYLSLAAAADGDFEDLLAFFHQSGRLNDTLLIVMSDHGHRFDAMRSTQIGRLEERLPFFAMVVPDRLVSSGDVSRTLGINRGRLTTPYDVHATLMDVLGHVTKGDALGSYVADVGLGRTLFGAIPANRTCKDAGVPPHYCVCEPEMPISVGDPKVRAAVRAVFNRLNDMLRDFRELCAELAPGKVVSAQAVSAGLKDQLDQSHVRHRIRITVTALPSEAIFEATVEVKVPVKSTALHKPLPYDAKVLDDISRINRYGDQSACIRHDILRKYCFCRKSAPIQRRAPSRGYGLA